MQLQMKGPKLVIFAITQMYEYKLFVLEYYQDKISTLRKYKNIHSSSPRLTRNDH